MLRIAFKSIAAGLLAGSLGLALPAAAIDFRYACEDCPANWGNLAGGETCLLGTIQSPIAFAKKTAKKKRLPRLRPRFGDSLLEVERLSTNFEAFVEEGLFTRVGQKRFELLQFHFHSTSEHVVDGERSAVEMHFVHRAADGALAVIGVFIEEGDNLDALDPLIEALSEVIGLPEEDSLEVEPIAVGAILPDSLRSYRYLGSTTTPACTEPVNWILLDEPIEMSGEQIAAIQDTIRDINDGFDNNRPIQNRNGRKVMTDVKKGDGDDDGDSDD